MTQPETQNSRDESLPIPMSSPDLTDAEREAVAAVLHTRHLSMGPQIQAFEAEFRQFCGTTHAIAVSSGTAGLHLCVRAAGIQDGDFVITSPFSFVASANVILFERGVPIFVDVDPITGNIDPDAIRAAAQDLTVGGRPARDWLPRAGFQPGARLKAILPIDVFGQPADMDPICEIANEYGLSVIEDSCEALGATYKGRNAGTLGDFGVFGFYPNKQITTGEGAVIVTDDAQSAALMRAMRNQGRAPGDTWLQHTHLGYNYRLDEMSAALGRVQLNRLDEMLAKRARVASWYNERLSELPGVESPSVVSTTTRMSWFVYVIRLQPELNRETVAQELKRQGVPARPYFVPIHLQPYMVERFGYQVGDFPVTEELGRCGLALPFSSVMTEGLTDQVVQALKTALQAAGRK